MNTDRSGINPAYTLGLSNGECVGDLAISHAVSDIIASGGQPIAITVALLLPDSITLGFVKEVMRGIEKSSKRYGAFLAGGDTKKNPKFAIVVTVIGKAKKEERLTRAKAKKGDLLVVSGNLGTMFSGLVTFKNHFDVSFKSEKILKNALIYQNPPYKLGLKISKAKIATACTDISDGLPSSIYDLCNASGVGAMIDESKIPIRDESINIAKRLNIRPMQLSLAGGDWQYLYTVPKKYIDKLNQISKEVDTPISIIGKIIEEKLVVTKTLEKEFRILKRIENDKFSKLNGTNYFTRLESKIDFFGEKINQNIIKNLGE